MYETLIRPVVLYGHETWTMLEEVLQALEVFGRRVLRTIFGGVRENNVWRRRMNHELAQLYGRSPRQAEFGRPDTPQECRTRWKTWKVWGVPSRHWREAAQNRVRWQRIWKWLQSL
uniref:(northern house mosquito) hypothetical protein n=1 Tax=Culex pipiens TaxID=7175 RepID=A0A8D8CV07_CULPI